MVWRLWPLCARPGNLPAVKFAMGLSLGEVTALTAAGVFDFATGLKVVAERGPAHAAGVREVRGRHGRHHR